MCSGGLRTRSLFSHAPVWSELPVHPRCRCDRDATPAAALWRTIRYPGTHKSDHRALSASCACERCPVATRTDHLAQTVAVGCLRRADKHVVW